MTEVVYTDEFGEWWSDLDEDEQETVAGYVEQLEALGIALGHPQSSAINGSKYPIRELRIQHKGSPYRVFYAFDPKRQAVLLLGGNKRGDKRFYAEMVPLAERIWERYLEEND